LNVGLAAIIVWAGSLGGLGVSSSAIKNMVATAPKNTPKYGKARINLERAAILLIDNTIGVDILSNIFYGFGARTLHRCRTVAEGLKVAESYQLDLIVIEALLSDKDGYDFVQALRWRPEYDNNRFTPVIVLSAHTARSKVEKARDCGANFFVAKPVSPQIIMDRLLWVAREKRQFLQTDGYAGPDRRFHDEGPPGNFPGRRREDRYLEQGV
jgi:CheY-like chemotaxis protein